MCPDWELKQQPLSLQAGTQSAEPYQPGLIVVLICISLMINDVEHPSFRMSIGHLHVLFVEVSIQVLCPFFNWIVWFLMLSFVSSL